MKKWLKYSLLLLFLARLVLAFTVWHPDVNNHVDWGIRFWEYGPGKFYSANVWNFTWPNQPPMSIYLYAFIRKVFEFIFGTLWWINVRIPPFPSGIITYFESNLYPALLQLPAILSDFGIAWIIYKLLKENLAKNKKTYATVASLIFLVNPVIWYNSSVWGQTDSVVNFFGLLAFLFLLKDKPELSLSAFAISIFTKVSLVIFAPLYIVVFLRKYDLTRLIKISIMIALFIGLISYPFAGGEPFGWLYKLYVDKILTQQLQVITANAFNLWSMLTGIHEQPHTLMLGPLSYQVWGLLLYAISYIPVLFAVYRKQNAKTIIWSLAIVAFSTFMLLTNMHERYLYPLFPLLTVLYGLRKVGGKVYWAITGLSLINLYNLWWVPKVDIFISILTIEESMAPRILGFIGLIIYVLFYRTFLRQEKLIKI